MSIDHLTTPCVLSPANSPMLSASEVLLATTLSTALYLGNAKLPAYDNGLLFITNYRIIFSQGTSISISLSQIESMMLYQGFLRSSPKITILVFRPAATVWLEWRCAVCEAGNTTIIESQMKCQRCGVVDRSGGRQPDGDLGISCPTCTFINMAISRASASSCEMCNTPLPSTPNPATSKKSEEIRISFRGSGFAECSAVLTATLNSKPWLVSRRSLTQSILPPPKQSTSGGVTSVLATLSLTNKRTTDTISTSFSDLDSLMKAAAEMTVLAASIMSRVVVDDETAEQMAFTKDLVGFGLTTNTTRKVGKSGFHEGLANEINAFLLAYMPPPTVVGKLLIIRHGLRSIRLTRQHQKTQ